MAPPDHAPSFKTDGQATIANWLVAYNDAFCWMLCGGCETTADIVHGRYQVDMLFKFDFFYRAMLAQSAVMLH